MSKPTIDSFFRPAATVLQCQRESCTGSSFANQCPPEAAIFKTASDPCSDSCTNYIPHPTCYKLTDARPAPEGKLDALDGTSGNYTHLVFGAVLHIAVQKGTSATCDGFSWLLRSWKTYPAPEKSRSQSQNARFWGNRPDPHPCPTASIQLNCKKSLK